MNEHGTHSPASVANGRSVRQLVWRAAPKLQHHGLFELRVELCDVLWASNDRCVANHLCVQFGVAR